MSTHAHTHTRMPRSTHTSARGVYKSAAHQAPARTRLAHMNLFIPLCLLCVCAAPQGGRLVEARSPPAAAAEPPAPPAVPAAASAEAESFVKRHHRDNNIAELLIPLLERSLQEPRAVPTPRRHNKPNKKVIQVLPYRGSGEHRRKGWRKLNSHKKQVVEITPLHGKNRAKPLAYILSAAQPSRGERVDTREDSASVTLERKYSSEDQQSSEELRQDSEDISVNVLRAESNASDSPSRSTGHSNEDTSSKERSASLTKESVSDTSSDDISAAEPYDDITAKKPSKYASVHEPKHGRSHVAAVTAEDAYTAEIKAITAEESRTAEETLEYALTKEVRTVTEEDGAATNEDKAASTEDAPTSEDKDVSSEEAVTAEGKASQYIGATSEDKAITVEDRGVTAEDTSERAVTAEDAATAESSTERAASADDVVPAEHTAERAGTSEHAVTAEITIERDGTAEDEITAEGRDGNEVTADITADRSLTAEQVVAAEDTSERDVSAEDAVAAEDKAASAEVIATYHYNKNTNHDRLDRAHRDLAEIKHLLGNLKASQDSEGAPSAFIENDIVIRHAHRAGASAENFGKMFGARARDIVELVQASTDRAHREPSRDHKSYRLSFLFNKK